METCITIGEKITKYLLDKNTLKIINQLNDSRYNGDLSITSTELTRKQFYSRITELISAGLIKKEKGRYYLTTFGKIVYDITVDYKIRLEQVIEDYWKLKAIDLLDISDELTNDEREKIIGSLFHGLNKSLENIELINNRTSYLKYSNYLKNPKGTS